MMEIGRLCVKIAGRDAGRKCVIIDVIDDNFVLIDGDVRRRKCNIKHLEPLNQTIEIGKGASHEAVTSEFKKLGLNVWETKAKPKTVKPKKVRRGKVKTEAHAEKKESAKPKKEAKKAKKE
jgi:large subunit ribosomal protein L14e